MGVGGYIVLNLRSWKDDSALAVLAEDPATARPSKTPEPGDFAPSSGLCAHIVTGRQNTHLKEKQFEHFSIECS